MIDLEGIGARQHAGDAGQRGFVHRGDGDELRGGQRRRRPHQRRAGEQAGQLVEARIGVAPRGIADRGLAGQQPRELEAGPGLGITAAGIALETVAVEPRVVNACVRFDFAERLDPGHQIVADARDAAVLVEVAVVVGRRSAVRQPRVLIRRAVHGPVQRDLQAVEVVLDGGRPAGGRKKRIPCETGLDIGTAGIVGTDPQPQFRIDAGIVRHVETSINLSGKIRPIYIRRHRRDDRLTEIVDPRRKRPLVSRKRAAQIGDERVAFPIGGGHEFGRHHIECRPLRLVEPAGIGVVAARQFHRRLDEETSDVIADGAERIVVTLQAAARGLSAHVSCHRRCDRRLVGGRRRRH